MERLASVVYHIVAHHKPRQLQRLVGALERTATDTSRTCVLLSRSSPDLEGMRAAAAGAWSVDLTVEPIRWGTWSLPASLLASWRQLLNASWFDWLVLLSGQCYPIKPLADLERMLGSTEHDAFLEFSRAGRSPAGPAPKRGDDVYWRYRHRHLLLPDLGGRINSLAAKTAWRLPRHGAMGPLPLYSSHPIGRPSVMIPRSSLPYDGWKIAHGSLWIMVSRRAVEVLCDQLRPGSPLQRYFHLTPIPDEAAFHTVLANSGGLSICDEDFRYIHWNRATDPHPATLTTSDIPKLRATKAYFARKFDADVDSDVLDALDDDLDLANQSG